MYYVLPMILTVVSGAEVSKVPHLDVGFSTGWNSPAGIAGMQAEYRPLEILGTGLGVGKGVWGWRITPQASSIHSEWIARCF